MPFQVVIALKPDDKDPYFYKKEGTDNFEVMAINAITMPIIRFIMPQVITLTKGRKTENNAFLFELENSSASDTASKYRLISSKAINFNFETNTVQELAANKPLPKYAGSGQTVTAAAKHDKKEERLDDAKSAKADRIEQSDGLSPTQASTIKP